MRNHGLHSLLLCLLLIVTPALAADWKPWKGGKTPALQLKDLQGQVRTLAEFRGSVVVLNFWATWCEPCVEEMPSLQRLAERHAGQSVVVLGVNLGEGEVRIQSFVAKTGTTFPLLLDRDGEAKKAWRVSGVPSTFLIDRTGRIRQFVVGEVDFAEPAIERAITKLASQPNPGRNSNARSAK